MPDRGRLDPLGITAGPLLRGEHAAPWVLGGARWAQVTFEVGQAEALAYLPEDLTRPVPAYARIVVIDAPDSPAGPFRLAALLVGGRFRLMPRNMLVQGVVDGRLQKLAAAFGAPFVKGAVEVEFGCEAVKAAVTLGGEQIAGIDLHELRAVDSALLRWDPWLGFAGPGDNIDLVEYRLEPRIEQAWLSKQTKLETPASVDPESPWRRLRCVNPISSCVCEGTLTLTVPEVLQALV